MVGKTVGDWVGFNVDPQHVSEHTTKPAVAGVTEKIAQSSAVVSSGASCPQRGSLL